MAPPWFCKFSKVHILFRGNRNTNTRPLLNNSAESWQLTSNQSIPRHSKQRNPHSVSISPFCFSSSKWQCFRGYTSLTADGSALGMPQQSSCQPTKLSDCRKVSSCSARACKMAPLAWAARSATGCMQWCIARLERTSGKLHCCRAACTCYLCIESMHGADEAFKHARELGRDEEAIEPQPCASMRADTRVRCAPLVPRRRGVGLCQAASAWCPESVPRRHQSTTYYLDSFTGRHATALISILKSGVTL
jgi:hypothetical protein